MSNHPTTNLHLEYAKLAVVSETLNFVHDHICTSDTSEYVACLLWGCTEMISDMLPRILEIKDAVEDIQIRLGAQQPA